MKTQQLSKAAPARAALIRLAGVGAAVCLLCSSVLAQLIVTPTVNSFSSAFGPRVPGHLVDGSGLTAGPSGILGAADSTHGNDVDSSMWYSDPFLTPPDTTPWVVLDMGGEYDLQTTRLWQFNQSPYGFTVYGAAEVEVSVSVDNTNFTSLGSVFPLRAGGTNGEPAQDFSTAANKLRYVKLQIWTSFGGAQATGLSEVRLVVNSNTAPPVITSQPQNQVATNGGSATFSVTAIGPTPISYQWRFNGTNLTDGASVSGATTSGLVLNGVSLASEGNYDVVVTNVNGPVLSAAARLVLGSPMITQQPQNWLNIVGQVASFTVAATDFAGNPANVTFQWQKNGTNLVNGGNISGATTTNLLVSSVTLNDDGGYRVLVTDSIIGKVTTSRTATLTAAPLPVVGLGMSSSQLLLAPGVVGYSSYFGPRTPTHLTDGSGLTVGPSGILGAADTTCDNNVDASMWYSDPFLGAGDTTPWVIFDLGGRYGLTTTRIWQYNQSPYGFTVYGAADVELYFSGTDTNSFTPFDPDLFPARAGGTNGEPAQDFSTPVTGVRYVKLQIWSSFGGAQATGLSEVRFVSNDKRVNVVLGQGVIGLHYQVQYSSSLAPGSWQVLQDIPSLAVTPLTVTDPTPPSAQSGRYYRAVLILP